MGYFMRKRINRDQMKLMRFVHQSFSQASVNDKMRLQFTIPNNRGCHRDAYGAFGRACQRSKTLYAPVESGEGSIIVPRNRNALQAFRVNETAYEVEPSAYRVSDRAPSVLIDKSH